MVITLTTSQIADRIHQGGDNGFSYAGARALAEYLEDLEESTGETIEFDAVAIRCDYDEHPDAITAAEEAGWDKDEDEEAEEAQEDAARQWLEDRTMVIDFEGGIIVQVF